jgi:hypothetical protein
MLLAAVAYIFSALNLAPLVFVVVGLSLDSDHTAKVESVNGCIRVTLAHPGSHLGHVHHHEWLSRMTVGQTADGHPDHIASFVACDTGIPADSDGLDVKCPASEMPAFEWLPLVADIHHDVVTGANRFVSLAPPDIRPMRPVVLLI